MSPCLILADFYPLVVARRKPRNDSFLSHQDADIADIFGRNAGQDAATFRLAAIQWTLC
jgi:hypothetical protein